MPSKKNFVYNIGDVINNRVIIDRIEPEYKQSKKYILKCLDCGTEVKIEEKRLISKPNMKCGVCNGKRLAKGINDVATLRPDLIKYFNNPSEASTIGLYNKKSRLFKCPNCGSFKRTNMGRIYRDGFKCKICDISNGSFGECLFKFILNTNNIKFEKEWVFDWGKNYRYDFYLYDFNCIVEIQGMQHYKDVALWNKDITLEQRKDIDNDKEAKALENGIDMYFRIDCKKSKIDYFLKQIKNSNILNYINLDINLDYSDFSSYYYKNIYEDVITRYINGEPLKSIAKSHNTSLGVMHNILDTPKAKERIKGLEVQQDKSIGEIREDLRKSKASSGIYKFHSNKDFICIETNKIYHTFAEASDDSGSNRVTISKCCNHKMYYTLDKNGNKLHWMFLNEFNNTSKEYIENLLNFKQYVKPYNERNYKKEFVCLNTGKIYNSYKIAAKENNTYAVGISQCCNSDKRYVINKETKEKLLWMNYNEYIKFTKQEILEMCKGVNNEQ